MHLFDSLWVSENTMGELSGETCHGGPDSKAKPSFDLVHSSGEAELVSFPLLACHM